MASKMVHMAQGISNSARHVPLHRVLVFALTPTQLR